MASTMNPPLRETNLAAQTEVPQQAPACPICQQTDKVRTIQAAFDLGVEPLAPPAMPSSTASMMPWIVTGFFIYLAGNIYLFVELAANSLSSWPFAIQVGSLILSLLGLLVGLVLSYLAVLRVGRADNELMEHYAAWDRAIETWGHLYYCLRDDVVIDLQEHRMLSAAEFRSLLGTEHQAPREQRNVFLHGDIHPPVEERAPEWQETHS
ncbi:MAG TPA: hypothetical protein VKT82_11705 [Ktedonobacterales bacterium]|nr:hypothetical protein [Ktedonobacterales bacterium]